jgi:hypothetical protein
MKERSRLSSRNVSAGTRHTSTRSGVAASTSAPGGLPMRSNYGGPSSLYAHVSAVRLCADDRHHRCLAAAHDGIVA